MNHSNILRAALSGLIAGSCMLGQGCSSSEKIQKSPPPEQNSNEPSKCGGGPTCASCTVPSDCSDVSDCSEGNRQDENMKEKRFQLICQKYRNL